MKKKKGFTSTDQSQAIKTIRAFSRMAKFITSLCLSDNRLGKLFVKRFIKCQSIQYTNTFKGSNNITHSGFTH